MSDREQRNGPLVEMKVDGANQTFDSERRRPRTNLVESEIQPFDRRAGSQRLVLAILEGGPLDGQEVEVPAGAQQHQASIPVNPDEVTPFVFDAEEHRKTKTNIVRGEYDTVTYRRSNRKSAEGLPVFALV
jgi:hypothetical protein